MTTIYIYDLLCAAVLLKILISLELVKKSVVSLDTIKCLCFLNDYGLNDPKDLKQTPSCKVGMFLLQYTFSLVISTSRDIITSNYADLRTMYYRWERRRRSNYLV